MKIRYRIRRFLLLTVSALAIAGCGAMGEEIKDGMAEISETPVKVVKLTPEDIPAEPLALKSREKTTAPSWRADEGAASGRLITGGKSGLTGFKRFIFGNAVPASMERVGSLGEREERLLDDVKRNYKDLPGVDPELITLAVTTGTLYTVHFGERDYSLSKSTSELVKKNGAWLKATPGAGVLIMGHTGQAGSRDFNVALGYRRGEAIKSFLVDMGIKEKRVRIRSYGSESPINKRNTDDAAKVNSRVEFIIIY